GRSSRAGWADLLEHSGGNLVRAILHYHRSLEKVSLRAVGRYHAGDARSAAMERRIGLRPLQGWVDRGRTARRPQRSKQSEGQEGPEEGCARSTGRGRSAGGRAGRRRSWWRPAGWPAEIW